MTFSEEMDRAATEGAFSVSAGGEPVAGNFLWAGTTLMFTPAEALALDQIHEVEVAAAATDLAGNRLVTPSQTSFTTGSAPAVAAITDAFFDLANLDEATLTADWPVRPGSLGSRLGPVIGAPGAGEHIYARNDLSSPGNEALMVEAVVNSAGGTAPESGARLHMTFERPDIPLIPPRSSTAELRLLDDGANTRTVCLFDKLDNTTPGGTQIGCRTTNAWGDPPQRLRIRLKRQRIGGVDAVVFEAEPNTLDATVFDDPDRPNDPATSIIVDVTTMAFAITTPEIGFGHVSVGQSASEWHSIHVSRAETPDEVFPRWPPAPPAPVLIYGLDPNPFVDVYAYLADLPLLDTDVAIISAGDVEESRTDPADEVVRIDGADGAVSAGARIVDLAGRSRAGPEATLVVPGP